jgi:hypothetical protein
MTHPIDLRVRQLQFGECRKREGWLLIVGIIGALSWLGVLWLVGAFS